MNDTSIEVAPRPATGSWAEYLRFEEALTTHFFTEEQAGLPVYLDMDSSAFQAAAASTELEPGDFTEKMVGAVRVLLRLGGSGHRVFHSFDERLKLWRRQFRDAQAEGSLLPAPPVVALLATFTAAAETMGDSKSTHIHDTAYYARLFNLLKVGAEDEGRFKESFRRSTEAYWDALRTWLEALDGNRGLPSAYSLNQRYVGLPISQALIRETERRQLKNMFADMLLPAGMGISQTDMEISLGQWISATPSPASASMRQLWANPDSRARIVEIAIAEFDAWDGFGRGDTEAGPRSFAHRAPRCSLAVSERHGLFGSTFDIAFVLPRSAVHSPHVELQTVDGLVDIDVTSIGIALCGASAASAHLDAQSLLSGILSVTADRDLNFQRFPRNVVPLVKDAFANVYVETERIVVGEASAVLVRDEGNLLSLVVQILAETARPGWTEHDASDGVPSGWVLITNLHILKTPAVTLVVNPQLDALVPRLSTQMTLSGGLRLPGRVARWSALDQPQLTVASEDTRHLRVTCSPLNLDDENPRDIELAAPQAAPFLVDLSEFSLPLGDYVITLHIGDKRVQTQTLRLRSSDTLDQFSWNTIQHLSHRDDDPLWPVRAHSGEGSVLVDGAQSNGSPMEIPDIDPPPSTRWRRQVGVTSVTTAIRIETPSATSCIVTGAHRIMLPTFTGKPDGRWIFGSCSECGITKRSPAQFWDKELRKRNDQVDVRSVDRVAELTPSQPSTRSWEAAIDALVYLGAGSAADLHTLARQIEDSASFEHIFVRSLEALGMIETERDAEFRIVRFEVASTSLTELVDTSFLMTGAWQREAIQNVYRAARRLNGQTFVVEPDSANIPLVSDVRADDLFEASGMSDVELVRSAGHRMLEILPRLTDVAMELARIPMEFATHLEFFATNSASWRPARTAEQPGAYRTKSAFSSTYLFRSIDDVEAGTTALVPFDLAKHLGALMTGKPLLAYNVKTQELRVPSGANLPGLYERAAVLCSGELPQRDASTFSLVYSEVDESFARALAGRFS